MVRENDIWDNILLSVKPERKHIIISVDLAKLLANQTYKLLDNLKDAFLCWLFKFAATGLVPQIMVHHDSVINYLKASSFHILAF